MLKKVALSTLFIGLIGILVAGAVIRTMDKTGRVAEAYGHGYGRGNSQAGAYAAGGSGQGRGSYTQGGNRGGYSGRS